MNTKTDMRCTLEDWAEKLAAENRLRQSAGQPESTAGSEVVLVPLSRGKYALVDAEDADRVLRLRWTCYSKPWGGLYAARKPTISPGRRVTVPMKRFILRPENDRALVDHINGNGLDNRKHNLRLCTHYQNIVNSSVSRKNKTGYKGVGMEGNRFCAYITFQGKRRLLGRFDTAMAGAAAYDRAAFAQWGVFARLNVLSHEECAGANAAA